MSDLLLSKDAEAEAQRVDDAVVKRCRARARLMSAALKKNNPKAHAMAMDPGPYVSGLCARRAGKTYTAVSTALMTGEAKPNSIVIVISLNKRQLKRLYFEGPAGFIKQARDNKLNVQFNQTELTWRHENGSIGYLLGADDEEQLEVIRGLEADLYIVDECKSFAPGRLATLITDILEPQRATRNGRLMLIGTPGHILAGPFYQATCERSVNKAGQPYSLPFGSQDPWGRTPKQNRLWSRHHWTLQDNQAVPHAWEEALITKASNEWPDDHPTWCREFLGYWNATSEGLVFRYGVEKSVNGKVNWQPVRTDDNPTGLPVEGAPWRLIAGLDIGFQAPTAFVICAYSSTMRQIRHVWDEQHRHLLTHDIAAMFWAAQERFGTIEALFADAANLGLTICTELAQAGLPIIKADKREKNDYLELTNGAFARGELKIIPETPLEIQLLTNAWDLGDGTVEELARMKKLVEDKSVPNDLTDALLYMYRGSLHLFGAPPKEDMPVPGSPDAVKAWEREQLRKARLEAQSAERADKNLYTRAPKRVQAALRRPPKWKSPIPKPSRTFYTH
jgi:Terminase large subunit, T4likevirus-type, N-terminal